MFRRIIVNLILIPLFYGEVETTVVLKIDFIKNETGRGVTLRTNEAEAIALDTTGNFLPIPSLVSKISKDLEMIREQFPDMKNITYSGTSIPGQLMVHQIKASQLKDINSSEFGPILNIYKLHRGGLSILEFKMPYNPYQLAEIIKVRFGVDNSPVVAPSFENSIKYDPGTLSKYSFNRGYGNCFVKEGCTNWNSWNYSVTENGTVSILMDLNSN